MNEISTLRSLAQQKRDEIIAQAREDYQLAIGQIMQLEQFLAPRPANRLATISHIINKAIPSDCEFTLNDVLTALRKMEPKSPATAWGFTRTTCRSS